MLEPLSESRRSLLLSLNLCSRADLRRAADAVRRLAGGLPAFDSVWLDALVQIGRLTPFQARVLESNHADRLQVGPCLLVDRLGGGPLGETFLARPRNSREQCVTRILRPGDHLTAEVENELSRVVEALRGIEHPSLAAARAMHRCDQGLVVVSRFVPGFPLGELLVRRGRFPPAVVWEIARQLADALAALEQRKLVHGDLRAAKVRMTRTGLAVLVDPGIRAAIDNELSVHSGLPPDRYDGVAPELIGRVARPTVASDMYALGCLLWQLLAGRPPFPGGDPLVKLAAHQTRGVVDVRQWAPETPAALAEGIALLTSRSATDRPARFSQLLERWGAPRPAGRRRLAKFHRWFEQPAPWKIEGGPMEDGRREAGQRVRRAPQRLAARLLVVVVLASLAAVALRHQGARSLLLSWTAGWGAEIEKAGQAPPLTASSTRHSNGGSTPAAIGSERGESFEELPAPDPQGVIRLVGAGRFLARDVNVVGTLTILGDETGAAPQIVVIDRPLRLSAESVRIRNVVIRLSPAADDQSRRLPALVLVQAQTLDVERCAIHVSAGPESETAENSADLESRRTGLGWKLLAPRDPQGGRATLRDTIFVGGDAALYVSDAVSRLEFVNCLRLGGGPLAQLAMPPNSRQPTVVRLEQTTCRGASNLFRVAPAGVPVKSGPLTIEAGDCVFDLARPEEGLLEITTSDSALETTTRIRIVGEGSLAPPLVETAVGRDPETAVRTPLSAGTIAVEGIFAGPYRFAGPFSLNPADAEIRDHEALRRSTTPPGIRSANLPAAPR